MEPIPASDSRRNLFRMAVLFEGGLILLALVLGWWMTPPVWERVQWSVKDCAWGIVATIPMCAGLFVMRKVRTGPLGNLNEVVDRLLVPLFERCSLLELGAISLLAGVGEEMLFRGVAQPAMIGWWGTWAGVLVASLAFGVVHAVTVTYALLATLVGVYFGLMAIVTGNLLTPMITHALYDWIALIYLTRNYAARAAA